MDLASAELSVFLLCLCGEAAPAADPGLAKVPAEVTLDLPLRSSRDFRRKA